MQQFQHRFASSNPREMNVPRRSPVPWLFHPGFIGTFSFSPPFFSAATVRLQWKAAAERGSARAGTAVKSTAAREDAPRAHQVAGRWLGVTWGLTVRPGVNLLRNDSGDVM